VRPDDYEGFTRALVEGLAGDDRVLGLVALGSMAARDYQPDEWSDHDFFVITPAGGQEELRRDLSWLPAHERIAHWYRETDHGLKVVYDDGHLLEFAVFDVEDLYLAQVNRYRVLLDRGGIEQHLAAIAAATTQRNAPHAGDDSLLFGQFLTNLLVGVGRHRRGEQISGRVFVKTHALRHLLLLLGRHLPSPRSSILDGLEPTRRFEAAFPVLGRELNALLEQPTPVAASGLLTLAARELRDRLSDYPERAVEVIAGQLR